MLNLKSISSLLTAAKLISYKNTDPQLQVLTLVRLLSLLWLAAAFQGLELRAFIRACNSCALSSACGLSPLMSNLEGPNIQIPPLELGTEKREPLAMALIWSRWRSPVWNLSTSLIPKKLAGSWLASIQGCFLMRLRLLLRGPLIVWTPHTARHLGSTIQWLEYFATAGSPTIGHVSIKTQVTGIRNGHNIQACNGSCSPFPTFNSNIKTVPF